MEGFDLGRLNPVSFERLVRALCFAKLGPAGTVYSSGPDGGRDFTYEGSIAGYEGKKWDGYLVIQAKFKDPMLSQADDIKWLATQLDDEFKKYTRHGSVLRKPQFYILVTNVRLSGADGAAKKKTGRQRKGGMTKALELFGPWKQKLKLKDVDIWSHDKIVDLLVGHPDIREAYAQWVTSGDVLSKAFQQFQSKQPNFAEVTNRSLKNSLTRDQFVRLKDAGSVGDLQIRTSQVIVDLPLANYEIDGRFRTIAEFGDEVVYESIEDDSDIPPDNAIAELVERAREKLDPETLLEDGDGPDRPDRQQCRNRIVLLGGPGQGKSTISLFLTQLFRAAILKRQTTLRRDQSVNRLVSEILKRAEIELISTHFPPRFPCHVSLPRFADVVSAARQQSIRPPSLLSHIASEIGSAGDDDIDRSDLRKWLQDYPWLLVLDGLDEVPPTGERPAVLEAINSFLMEVNELNADILILVTTRPQGYNKDLDENVWEHWRLADLRPEQALRYAKAFGEARYPDDSLRRADVHASLVVAAGQAATARLMTSPLQVTILHFIVDTGGGVPTARWTLFHEYFEVLKKREKAKGGELQKILERHWGHLGPIHHRAGLVLQTDSEHGGGAGSRFTHERLRLLIHNYLSSEGFAGAELSHRVDELMKLAIDRLVLLSQQVEGTVSFDVRSLQEFMAAAAITSGDQAEMDKRLSHIAGHSHWRHVFQIAASRCFADDALHYRRPVITQIARQMDTTEPDMVSRNGARLALDLLADGVALDHPNFRRPLLQHALEQLDLGKDTLDYRLATVCDESMAELLRDDLTRRIVEGSRASALSTWKLIFQISQLGKAWADDLIIQLWPTDGTIDIEAWEEIAFPLGSQRVIDHLALALSNAGPTLGLLIHGFANRLTRQKRDDRLDYTRLRKMNFADRLVTGEKAPPWRNVRLLDSEFPKACNLRFVPIHSPIGTLEGDDFSKPAWEAMRLAAQFASSPSKKNLAACIRAFADSKVGSVRALSRILPWPISTLLREATGAAEHLKRLASEIEAGSRGDVDQWIAAEKRWKTVGLVENDFCCATEVGWFGPEIAERGAPLWLDGVDRPSAPMAMIQRLIAISRKVENRRMGAALRDAAASLVSFGPRRDVSSESEAELILDVLLSSRYRFSHGAIEFALGLDQRMWSPPAIANKLGNLLSLSDGYEANHPAIRDIVLKTVEEHPDFEGLLYPAALILCNDDANGTARLLQLFSKVGPLSEDSSLNARLATAIVRLVDCPNLEECVEDVLGISDHSALISAFLSGELLEIERRLDILTMVIKKLRQSNSPKWRNYIGPARKALDARKSDLTNASVWEALELPQESFEVLLPVVSARHQPARLTNG
ncbi:hypothetical protein IVB38_13860 [Bradyrhizobium sp. 38]|uniref:NACHT domain-containing protein n=1 Tax=unclassified Bradyrhizobium TaxID=2631580 RepID=UPI001FF9698A|nr:MULTISPECIES: hypothetical protein [unclassified Bradyrhizobium]MCK1337081.1 hypothetical protein [Bradyrhizobium sp. 38]MCK1778352.1 hypothetical protein [Bradyrhizobium sp. 132]